MTIIKQTGVQSKSHMKNLRAYINDDRKVLLRDNLNMDGCADPKRWMHRMFLTREMFGHNKSARRVRDKETGELKQAKNTVLYHQILAFNPDECDLNGGALSPGDCMRYAKEYVGKHYPNQEVVMALHNEYCKADKTHRYAVHIVINRSDLSTGKRLDEGRGREAKAIRASRIREMDREWGLKQVVRDERNSEVHKKQPSKIERELAARGVDSYKTNLRELCRLAAEKAEGIYDYRETLESWGVETAFRGERIYVTDTDNNRYSFSVAKLDADLNMAKLEDTFGRNALRREIHEKGLEAAGVRKDKLGERERVAQVKSAYLSDIRRLYREYRETVRGMEGMEFAEIPKLRFPRPAPEIASDPEVKRVTLACWRGGDEMRLAMSSDTVARKKKDGGSAGASGTQQARNAPEVERPGIGQTKDGR